MIAVIAAGLRNESLAFLQALLDLLGGKDTPQELRRIMQLKPQDRPAEEVEAVEEDAADEDCDIPSTGIPTMDMLLDNLDAGKLAMVYAIIRTMWYNKLYQKVRARLEYLIDKVDTIEGVKNAFDGDPDSQLEWNYWTGFRCAAERASAEL